MYFRKQGVSEGRGLGFDPRQWLRNMKILIVDNHTKNLNELINLLTPFDIQIITKEEFKKGVEQNFDTIILTGGSNVLSVKNHREEYQDEIDFLKSTDKKVIGICLGCEIIAIAFGCSLVEKKKESGIFEITYNNEIIPVYESHRFAIENVSNEIEILGRSDNTIKIIKHTTKPIFGMQFHPEMFVEKTKGKDIFLSFLLS